MIQHNEVAANAPPITDGQVRTETPIVMQTALNFFRKCSLQKMLFRTTSLKKMLNEN